MVGQTILSDDEVVRIQDRPPAYEAKVHCVLSRPQIAFEVPFKPGARQSGSSRSIRIWEVTREKNSAAARVTGTVSSVMKNGIWFSNYLNLAANTLLPKSLLAVNRASGTFSSVQNESKPATILVGGVVINWDKCRVHPDMVVRNRQWVHRDSDWLEHTTLALVPFQGVARFTREVKAEKYELEPRVPEKPMTDKPL